MIIEILYDSKYSLSTTRDGESYLTSMSIIKDNYDLNQKNFLKRENHFLENVNLIKKKYPNYDYKSISLDTVIGLLCRFVGDVRRLNDLYELYNGNENEHLILSLKDKIKFKDDLEFKQFQSELLNLHTPIKEVQNSSSGIISKNNCLNNNNYISERLFSIFNSTDIQDIKTLYKKIKNNDLSLLNDVYNSDINPRKMIKEVSIFEKITKENQDEIDLLVDFKRNGKREKINNIGIVLFCEKIRYLLNHPDCLEKDFLNKSISQKSLSFSGLAKDRGTFTPKDFYSNFVNEKKKSWTMPYIVDLDFNMLPEDDDEKKEFNFKSKVGVVKECGKLIIEIDCSAEEEIKINNYINNSGTQVFHMGKKGLAYINKIQLEKHQ